MCGSWQSHAIVADSPGTKVLHNTVILEDGYANAIESRFRAAKGLLIAGNLTNKAIRQRHGSGATLKDNMTNAAADWFVQAAGDLHLSDRWEKPLRKAHHLDDCPADFDGQYRPRDAATDVGAYEWQAGAMVPRHPTMR
jgi:hypothetical protein